MLMEITTTSFEMRADGWEGDGGIEADLVKEAEQKGSRNQYLGQELSSNK